MGARKGKSNPKTVEDIKTSVKILAARIERLGKILDSAGKYSQVQKV